MTTVGANNMSVKINTYILPIAQIIIPFMYCLVKNSAYMRSKKMGKYRPCLYPIIISLSVEISINTTKHSVYFSFCGNPLQRFVLREAKSEKQENLRLAYNLSVSEKSGNK
jgi:hypothetical protein